MTQINPNDTVAATLAAMNARITAALADRTPVFIPGTVKANPLVVKSKGPVDAQASFAFEVGTDTPAFEYISDAQCENEVWVFADEQRANGIALIMVGGAFFTPELRINGSRVEAFQPAKPTPTVHAKGDVTSFTTDAKRVCKLYLNGNLQTTYYFGDALARIEAEVGAGNARWVHVIRNGYANAEQHPQITVSGGSNSPLTLNTSNIDTDGYAFWNVDYIGDPAGYLCRIEDLTGKVVKDWRQAKVTNNTVAGKATLTSDMRVSALNVSYVYKLVEANLAGAPKDGALVLEMRRTRPGVPSIGSNLADISRAYRKTRTYTNTFHQCYVQATVGFPQYPVKDSAYELYPNFIDHPDLIDFDGNPLVSGLIYQMQGPEKEGNHTLELTAKTGTLDVRNLQFAATGGAGHPSNARQNGANSVLFDFRVDLESLRTSGTSMFGVIFQNVEATLPKGLFCCTVGEDKTKRFYGPFLDRLKAINGPIRHMDSNWANEPWRYDNGLDDWSIHRSRRDRIGAQKHGMPLEDMVELSKLTNRPVWFNLNHGLMYSTKGEDYLRKSLDLIFNGKGGDLGYGVSKALRHKVEMGNENWNPGLGNWHFLAAKAKANGRGDYSDDGAKHGVSTNERLYQHARVMPLLAEVVPDFASYIDRVFGGQVGRSDIGFAATSPIWAQVEAASDRMSIAGYLPGDPTAGFAAGQQPASHSPEDVVSWLRTYIAPVCESLSQEIQHYATRFNKTTDLYEYNIAFPAIFQRTPEEERIIKSSQVFYDFMLNEYLPAVIAIGGDSCIYSDDGSPAGLGTPTDQSWYFFESSYTGAGNKAMEALLEYARIHGYVGSA